MSEFRRGDIVSLSRAQSVVVAVDALSAPGVFSIGLPHGSEVRTYAYEAADGATAAEIATGLVDVLLNLQTIYSAAVVDEVPGTFMLVGPLGVSFAVVTSAGVAAVVVEAAVLALSGEEQRPIGPIRLLEVTNTLERLREFTTRDRDGVMEEINLLQGRELDTSYVFDFKASQVLTVLHREGA